MQRFLSGLLTALLTATALVAAPKLPAFFSNHLVLQRELAVPIWGTAKPGEKITVSFAGQTKTATAAADGRWLVRLDALKASEEGRPLVVSSPEGKISLADVVVGEVWLAGGQSNMGSPLHSGATAQLLPTATDTLLRFFTITKAVAAESQTDLKGKWEPSSPEAAKGFSAVAYLFAQEIRRTQKVPVGVFNGAWGGTPLQTWLSLPSVQKAPALAKPLAEWETSYAQHLKVKDQPQLMTAYLQDLKDWETRVGPAFKAALSAHNEEMAAARAAGQPTKPGPKPERPEPTPPDPLAMPAPSKRPSAPTISYNAMIAPLATFALKGVIWYQGEADGSRGAEYQVNFPRLIEGWRQAWGQGDFPFLFVQLPGCYDDNVPVASKGWAFLREAQFLTAQKVPFTGMVVTSDVGDPKDVHPDNKLIVGARLALVGRKVAYGEKIDASGPLYASYKVEGQKLRVQFTETAGGLTIGEAPWVAKGVTPLPKDKLVGFYLAGEDKKWVAAEARIEGNSVVLSHPGLTAPVAARYAWAAFPRANLANRAGLPAAPFRTDDWK